MYEAYLREENLFLVAEDQNKIIGFCMGYMHGTKAMDIFYKNNTGTLLKRTLCLLIQGHPLVWKKGQGHRQNGMAKDKTQNDQDSRTANNLYI